MKGNSNFIKQSSYDFSFWRAAVAQNLYGFICRRFPKIARNVSDHATMQ